MVLVVVIEVKNLISLINIDEKILKRILLIEFRMYFKNVMMF